MSKTKTYQDGYDALLKRSQGRCEPLEYAPGETLPGLDDDLGPLCHSITTPNKPANASSFADKRWQLQSEFIGQPDILWLHGLVIANLRKDRFPDHTPALFQKLWADHGGFFLKHLPLRWLVSAAMTFGDHGANEAQRQTGRSLSLLFSMMKLYEFERLYSGKPPQEAYSSASKHGAELPVGIPAYSLRSGGLDTAVLSRIWKDCREDQVIEPLAKHLLEAINDDPGTLFRRLQIMSGERRRDIESKKKNPIPVPELHIKRDPDKIRWAAVATINEDLDQAVAFAAHHVALGANRVVLFAEDPDNLPRELNRHDRVRLVFAGERILPAETRQKMTARNTRKVHYFNRARRKMKFDWLAMLDTDEFLVPDRSVHQILAEVPDDSAFLTLPVVEKFAGSTDAYRAPASQWALPREDQLRLFPNHRHDVANLILGPSEPRLFVRSRLRNIRAGNYVLKYKRAPATNNFTPPDLRVAHNHTEDLASFLKAMPRRLDQGYTRRGWGETAIRTTLDRMTLDADSSALEQFFTEIATARPEVLSALQASGDLQCIDLNLQEKINNLSKEIAQ